MTVNITLARSYEMFTIPLKWDGLLIQEENGDGLYDLKVIESITTFRIGPSLYMLYSKNLYSFLGVVKVYGKDAIIENVSYDDLKTSEKEVYLNVQHVQSLVI